MEGAPNFSTKYSFSSLSDGKPSPATATCSASPHCGSLIAKAAKDFAQADELRKKIDELGYVVIDSRDGGILERKK